MIQNNKAHIDLRLSLCFWLIGCLLITFLSISYSVARNSYFFLLLMYIYPLGMAFTIYLVSKLVRHRTAKKIFIYGLFFSISFTSYFGITKIMDGSYASSSNLLLFGLSFYSVSLAFTFFRKNYLTLTDVLFSSNPILIFTGPILVTIRSIKYRELKKRIKYFLPFIIFGLFLVEVISTTITPTFFMANNVDLISSLGFAIIFELFIYANFCGLSLMIYGFSGIIGYQIPLNFKQPFSSRNVMEFWRGWHISLSNVLKEFFYIPIRKKSNIYVAIFFVFLSSALWHGVSLTFILWGMLHFFSFGITIFLIKRNFPYLNTLILVIAIILGRLIFLESDLTVLLEKLQFKYSGFGFFDDLQALPKQTVLGLSLIMIIVLAEFFFKKNAYFRNRNYKFYRLLIPQIMLSIFIVLSISESSGFLYPVYGQR